MRTLLTLTLICVTILTASARSVTATIVDSADAEPLTGVYCHLYAAADTTRALASTASDADGRMSLSIPKAGNYLLSLSYTGMKQRTMEFVAADADVNLGTIPLEPDTELLGEVEVTARKPLIQSTGERVTYNVQDDPTSGTSTIIEMLRKVPLVTVDAQDNIKVNGQSSFKILVNGKENPMFNSNPKEVLKSMPASSVVKIEVITEPGAKYDAEGTGGILNIITTAGSSIDDGYLATLRGSLSTTTTGAGIYAIAQKGKVTASLNYNFSRAFHNPDMKYDVDRAMWDDTGETGDGISHLLGRGAQTNKYSFHSGNFDLSWEPDTLNLFNVNANIFYGAGGNTLNYIQRMMSPQAEGLWEYTTRQHTRWDYGSYSLGASYQHTFADSTEHHLILSYLYSHGVNKNKADMLYYDAYNYIPAHPFMRNDLRNPTNEHTLQLDYTHPFSPRHTLEAGAKGIFRRNTSHGVNSYGNSADDAVEATTGNVSLRQFQDIGAVYASYSGTYGKFRAKAGLRYEHTRMGVDFVNHEMPDFSTHLNDLVPNAALAYSFAQSSTIRLAYQMRISRPSVYQLNPFRDESNPMEVSYGNPDLSSERSNMVTLTYANFGSLLGLNLSMSYARIDNCINSYNYMLDGTEYSTYANIGNQQNTSFDAYVNLNFSSRLQWTIYSGVTYSDYRYQRMDITSNGWGYYVGTNLNYTMPADIRLSVYGGFGRGDVDLQSSQGQFNYYSLSLSRGFLKDKCLEVSLSASNFFGPMRIRSRSWTATSSTSMHITIPQQQVGISVTYRIGSLSGSVKKVNAAIDNDDLKSSSSPASAQGAP